MMFWNRKRRRFQPLAQKCVSPLWVLQRDRRPASEALPARRLAREKLQFTFRKSPRPELRTRPRTYLKSRQNLLPARQFQLRPSMRQRRRHYLPSAEPTLRKSPAVRARKLYLESPPSFWLARHSTSDGPTSSRSQAV